MEKFKEQFSPERSKKKYILAAIMAGILLVGAAVTLFFSSSARDEVKNGAALAVNSWNAAFGGGDGGFLSSETDISGSDTSTGAIVGGNTPSADSGSSPAPGGPAQVPADADQNAPVKVPAEIVNAPPDIPQSSSPSASDTVAEVPPAENDPAIISPVPVPACTPSLVVVSSSQRILLNEVAWMGSVALAGETATKASDREWMELKNNSGTIDLSGWQLLDTAGNIKIFFGDGDRLSAGDFYLLERGDDAVPNIAADKIYSGGLSNAGDGIFLFDAGCGLSDVVDASSGWSGGDNTTKQTLERNTGGNGWHTSVAPGGTPKAENSVPVVASGASVTAFSPPSPVVSTSTPTALTGASTTPTSTTGPCPTSTAAIAGHLLINAISTAGASSTNDFVKIVNPTPNTVDISGWNLRKKTSTGSDASLRVFPAGSAIAAGGTFTWANSSDGFSASIGANASSTGTLAGDNSVALLNASDTIVDAVAWGTGTNQYSEGNAYPTDPSAGQVLQRKSLNGIFADTGDNANDFTLQ